ncbi:hypothetical protein CAAN1_23S01046 [[Candida] anglica]|uniref:Uncharacterized protein n=1 Tax=[Candida] anglica TaxID=148631 RepID=A0ABP0E9X9_9ASCO
MDLDRQTTEELMNEYGKMGRVEEEGGKKSWLDDSLFPSDFIELGRSNHLSDKNVYDDDEAFNKLFNRSPTKRRTDPIYKSQFSRDVSPIKYKSSFDDLSIYSDFNKENDTIDKELKKYIGKTSVLEEENKTELIIQETHYLVNNVPSNIMNNKEGENYQKLLASSINKLVKQLEITKIENNELKKKQENISNLKDQVYKLENNLKDFRNTNENLRKQLNERIIKTNQNVSSNKECELLRKKLIKYKNLYDEKVIEVNELKKVNIKSEIKNDEKESSNSNLKKIIIEILKENGLDKRNQTNDYNNDKESHKEELQKDIELPIKNDKQNDQSSIDKIFETISKNQELRAKFTKLLEEIPPNKNSIKGGKLTNNDNDIVVKCYVCYPDSRESKNQETCKQCSTKEGEEVVKDRNDTMNMMGEYKWTL